MSASPEKALPPELWDRLATNEEEAWRTLLRLLLPLAMQGLRQRFGLLELHGGDELATEAALWSAWNSFQKHFLRDEFEDATDLETLATHFLRIAYNRWQRARRRQRQMENALEQGSVPGEAGQRTPREFVDRAPRPNETVEEREFSAYLWTAIDKVMGEFDGPRRQVLQLYFDAVRRREERTQADIAKQLGIHQATVSRCLNDFFDRVRELLEETQEE